MYKKFLFCVVAVLISADASAAGRADKRFIKAVASGNVESVEKALDRGDVDLNVKDRKKLGNGNTALEFALENKFLDIAELLIERGARTRGALFSAIWREDEAAVRFLVENGVDPNSSDDMGRSALGTARSANIQELLLELGATIRCGTGALRQISPEGEFVVIGTIKDCDLSELEFYDPDGNLVCSGEKANRGCK